MKRIIFFLSVATIGVVSCKDKKIATKKDTLALEQKTPEVAAPDPEKDSVGIRIVMVDFYNWYTKNFAEFQESNQFSGIKMIDMPPNKVNWDQVTKYLDYIRTSVRRRISYQSKNFFFSNAIPPLK